MEKDTDKDERKRGHLRLVVNNPEAKRASRPSSPEDDFVPFDELLATREEIRPLFYTDLAEEHATAYQSLESFFRMKGWEYALDPNHGRLMVLPALAVAPEAEEAGIAPQDEILLFVTDDARGSGLCLSVEMILPFYSDDESIMEDALLYSPIFQYGTLFLEENRQDGLLDLIYRIGSPLFPPAPDHAYLDRIFMSASWEIGEAMRNLSDFQGEG